MQVATPDRTTPNWHLAGVGAYLAMWLLSIALAVGLGLGQAAEAGGLGEHHLESPVAAMTAEVDRGNGASSGPACHPGIFCAIHGVPNAPLQARSEPVAGILRPVLTQSENRFGGPTVALPPPRTIV
jgi:hypothetical protein